VEHDAAWAAEVQRAVAAQGLLRWTVKLVLPVPGETGGDPADPARYSSSDPDQAGKSFRAYASAIDGFADGSFQVVVVDGRARPACLRHAMPKVAPGGWLLLDNAERASYGRAQQMLAERGWTRQAFEGPSPYSFNFSQTCVWQRP